MRSGAPPFTGVPKWAFLPLIEKASSSVIVLPTKRAPASSRRCTVGARARLDPGHREHVRRAAARRIAGDVEQVLDREGQPGERALRARCATGDGRIGHEGAGGIVGKTASGECEMSRGEAVCERDAAQQPALRKVGRCRALRHCGYRPTRVRTGAEQMAKNPSLHLSRRALDRRLGWRGLAATAPGARAWTQGKEPVKIGELNSYSRMAAFAVPYRNGCSWRWTRSTPRAACSAAASSRSCSATTAPPPGDATRVAEELRHPRGRVVARSARSSPMSASRWRITPTRRRSLFIAAEPLTDAITMAQGNRYTFRVRPIDLHADQACWSRR